MATHLSANTNNATDVKQRVWVEWKIGLILATTMPPQVRGFHVPEDVVHLIFEEIIFQGDRATFHTAALISFTFLYVAQHHLYRSYTLKIGDPTSVRDITTLLDIIERRPYIATFIKEFNIFDTCHSKKKTIARRYTARREQNGAHLQHYDSQYQFHESFLEIFTLNRHNLLPRLCHILTSLSTLNFAFQRSQLDWHALHEDVKCALEDLFNPERLVTARLNGVLNTPSSTSSHLFNLRELEFNNCHFSIPSQSMPLLNRHATDIGGKNHMRRLYMDIGQERANFEQIIWHWYRHQITIPQVDVVCLSINGWYGAWDAAVVLGTLGSWVKELSLSTSRLELSFVQQQPPRNPFLYPSMYEVQSPRINSHAIGECFATNECGQQTTPVVPPPQPQTPHSQYVTSGGPSWFLQLMSPLRPRFHLRSFVMLRKLNFEVSHWRSATETEANGELFWIISWLAELPLERAENIRELSIVVRVGTDFCLDNTHAMTELAGYEGWSLLDMIVAHPNWRSLEKVIITVRSRTTCLCAVEEKFRVLLESVKKSMLPQLNARGIVDVTYRSLESSFPS